MRKILTAAILLCATGWFSALGQNERPKGDHGHRSASGTNYFNVAVPPHPVDMILARPEDRSVTVSVLAYHVMSGGIWYGMQPDALTNQTTPIAMPIGEPANFTLRNLSPNAAYYGQFRWLEKGNSPAEIITNKIPFQFHTARAPGSPFTFTMTADVHLDEHTSAQVYQRTLANIRTEEPDFHIDLGNLFMTDKHATRDEAWRQYLAQRYYLNQLGSSLFLALGVHDGEASRYDDGSQNSLAVESNARRKKYFPNPDPDNFYTGDTVRHGQSGLLENYYAWTWGDALFVVLDPYRYSLRSGGRNSDGWNWSLGREQYDWLTQTLTTSKAKYKFIFIHNLLAGDQASRGGVEIAKFNEWGGKNLDGSDGFAQHRPGWPLPVHQLLLKNHVTAVFKAHDNFYARQELDGITYIMVPQPSFAGDDRIRDLENYGYKEGVFRGNSGFLRVHVSPEKLLVEYVNCSINKSILDSFQTGTH